MSDPPDGGIDRGGRTDLERWVPALAVALVILVASVVPIPVGRTVDSGLVGLTDPFHLIGYAALTASMAWGLRCGKPSVRRRRTRCLLVAAVVGTAYGGSIELLQATIPWRSFATADVLLNAVGALIGAVAVAAWIELRRREDESR